MNQDLENVPVTMNGKKYILMPAEELEKTVSQPLSSLAQPMMYTKPNSEVRSGLARWIPYRHDYDDCANFRESDHTTEDKLVMIRGIFGYCLVMNVLTTYWLNWDATIHMLAFFSYWGSICSLLGITFSFKAMSDKPYW